MLSRTAAPMIVTNPTKRKRPIAERPIPSFGSNSRRRRGTFTTGTIALPTPFDPVSSTVMLFEPPLISHSLARYSPGSPSTGVATSGGGAPPVASNLLATTVTRSGRSLGARTKICATPGTTPGICTCTVTLYGPAFPSNHASGLPTWAERTTHSIAKPRLRPSSFNCERLTS